MVASFDTQSPHIVIVGITGNQGGSVAKALIESFKPYRITGLTRDASKPTAQAWAQKGVKLHQINLAVGNEAAVVEAFSKASAVYASPLYSILLSYRS